MDRRAVQQWLREVCGPRERIYMDVDRVMDTFPGLSPRTEVYTYDDGRTALLLCVGGTIPVCYHGVVYNIPIHMWLPYAYPTEAPIVYVVPTQDMLVRQSASVELSGRVTVDNLRVWERKPEGADIVEAVHACQTAFAQVPPVYAKQAPSTQPSTQPSTPKPQRPPKPGSVDTLRTAPPRPERPDLVRTAPETHRAVTPPRPPNPELVALHATVHAKLTARLRELRSSMTNANAQLRLLQEDLARGKPAIEDEMQRLHAVKAVCMTNAEQLRATIDEARERTAEMEQRRDTDVDAMLVATSIVENQLLQLVAEDQAIEDTLYQLCRALHAEHLSLDHFIKHTRMLAREQFLRRALVQKIVRGIGW